MESSIRQYFPSLGRVHNNKPITFLDGPAGTQVPQPVIDAISRYYRTSNANTHGSFVTTRETDDLMAGARSSVSTFLGSSSGDTISFGANMTSLNFALARALSRVFKKGDEVVITELDHEANRGPWLTLKEFGVIIREVKLRQNGTLDDASFASSINDRTRLVCMGMSSNCIGTVNDFHKVRQITRKKDIWLLLDAVHYAPHFAINVTELDCDFLLCSAYKFYGPHVGILYTRPGLLDQFPTDRLRVQDPKAPYRIETGTLNHAAIVGVSAAIEFIAGQGNGSSLRQRVESAFERISKHEYTLAEKLYRSLGSVSGVRLVGTDFSSATRTPTVSFTFEGKTPLQVCERLALDNICCWDGHFYAIRAIEALGLLEKGGVTRMGISMYNTNEEVDRTVAAVASLT